MEKLTKSQISKILPMYTGKTPLGLQFALELQYAYHDENPFGKPYDAPVYADDADNPHVLLIGTGWMQLYGDAAYDESDLDLYDFILNQFDLLTGDEKRIALNVCSPDYVPKLEKLFQGHVTDKWIRHNYRLSPKDYPPHGHWRDNIPDGFEMRYFDVTSGDFLDKHNNGRDFWFPESKRFGFALVKDDEIISDCISVYYEKETHDADTARVVEIGIDTKEAYQRQGFAFLTAQAFIEYCLSHDLVPNWGCWSFKTASQALAKKLGFMEISQRTLLLLEK